MPIKKLAMTKTAPVRKAAKSAAHKSVALTAVRCSRCGRKAAAQDKFCAECGLFLRDAFLDHRILHALVEEKDGNGREARLQLERLLQSEPDNALANHILGTFYFHQGTLDLAIERYEKAIALAPKFLLAHYDLGVAWYHHANMPRAIRAFRQCLKIDPNYNAAHYRLAVSLFHAGEHLMAHYHIGVIHERRGETAAAEREFRRSLDESIGEVSSLFHLALIRRAAGDTAGADELLQRAREFGRAQSANS
jgi:tetratricopeptide (TPR) repeat protein